MLTKMVKDLVPVQDQSPDLNQGRGQHQDQGLDLSQDLFLSLYPDPFQGPDQNLEAKANRGL